MSAVPMDPGAKLKLKEATVVSVMAAAAVPPVLHLRSPSMTDPSVRVYDQKSTEEYLGVLGGIAVDGLSFENKTVVITGAGPDSIGIELVKGLLRGGAKIYVTTSRFDAERCRMYNEIYDRHGAKGSELVVLPFNQASVQDITSLVQYIYTEGSDIDYIIPFAAMPEAGRDIGRIDSRSELSHRIMLTNLLRLIGAVKNKKEELAIVTRPAHVLLPLSPNHGIFGFDGLYAESKLGLEAVLNKWKSERWDIYLSIAGAIIGWTRGTGIMDQNNVIAPGIEDLGASTFSTQEMAFALIGLLHPTMVKLAQLEPLVADLTGGLHLIPDLNVITSNLRASLLNEAALKKSVVADNVLDVECESSVVDERAGKKFITPRALVTVEFPEIPSKEKINNLAHLRGLLDLERVIVVTGFGEFGPYGNARTRWDIEKTGEFSLEGCIELAWMMGLIEYKTIDDPRNPWGGWVDRTSGERVLDHEIKARYEETILRHTGIRILEPELFDGYDPYNKVFLHQVALNADMSPLEVSEEEAHYFKQKHGPHCTIYQRSGIWYVQFLTGAVLYIPKALRFSRFVAGQIPTTWNPAILGIPEDIIRQVDRVTLFTLVSTVEALVASGITDPYEFYQYVHVSEVGNSIGSGFGGTNSMRAIHRLRFLETPVQSDALQEAFINTVPAWINMLLLSSSGPIKTPVGACATAVESLELGMDAITTGKAKIVIVGGYDDFGEEGSYEFAQMRATSNAEEETAAGRAPREMSRPTTTTRNGFMESQGAGVQILMSAKLALDMGVPIYAILQHVTTATDKQGRSIPAPGRGILTSARERSYIWDSPLLDISYRKKQVERELENIEIRTKEELDMLDEYAEKAYEPKERAQIVEQHKESIEFQKKLKIKAAQSVWGNNFYVGNPHIAPIRGALAVYGLTVDDIGVASFHGTGTKANDLNESEVLQQQFRHLGRSKGNVIFSIFQKYLTGHPKGAAAAWMLNGLIQSFLSGIVPGNRNADNIDTKLSKFDYVTYTSQTIRTYGFKAAMLKSFGFGQVGGEVLVVHPDYVLAQLTHEELDCYVSKREQRKHAAYRHIQNALYRKIKYINVKEAPPFQPENETSVYLDPLARATRDKDGEFRFFGNGKSESRRLERIQSISNGSSIPRHRSGDLPVETTMPKNISQTSLTNLEVTLREMSADLRSPIDRGIGVDAQLISEIEVSIENSNTFLTRNFTPAEISYCQDMPDPISSFAGRWAAKEAVIKAISSCDTEKTTRNLWQGEGAPLRNIEILKSPSGAPMVHLHGRAKEVATLLGISEVKVSISHSGDYAIAQATSR